MEQFKLATVNVTIRLAEFVVYAANQPAPAQEAPAPSPSAQAETDTREVDDGEDKDAEMEHKSFYRWSNAERHSPPIPDEPLQIKESPPRRHGNVAEVGTLC